MSGFESERGASPRRGFTLVELLIVMAIIAILATILFPVFATARDRARQSSCASNMKQIYTAFKMYAQDYDNRFPDAAVIGTSAYRYIDDIYSMPTALQPYIKSEEVWYCPNMKVAMKAAKMPGYHWTANSTQLKAPDNFENGTSNTNILLWDNYIYKMPSTKDDEDAGPTAYSSSLEGRYCPHSGRTNFNSLYFDGHVKLYPNSLAKSQCKLQVM